MVGGNRVRRARRSAHPAVPDSSADGGRRRATPSEPAQPVGDRRDHQSRPERWAGLDGTEIEDNNGVPGSATSGKVTLGTSAQNPYYLQRESNNAGALEFDPATYFGARRGDLAPEFVVPSAVDQGDVVQFDGSATASTLMSRSRLPVELRRRHTAIGPSVEHSYAKGGSYNVKLTVTDRGGNTATLTQTIQVLGANGQTVAAPDPARAAVGLGLGLGLEASTCTSSCCPRASRRCSGTASRSG